MPHHDRRQRERDVPPVWTVDTWRVRPGREPHFLELCRALHPDALILYRDVEEPGLFWSPAKWESHEALKRWRAGARYADTVRSLEDDVLDHQTHVMVDVPGFLPTTAPESRTRYSRQDP
jgi:heme-degrading monooxygenase HmoA